MNAFNLNLLMARSALRDRRLGYALDYVRRALGLANTMRDRKRAALCLRILNWIRADIARTV